MRLIDADAVVTIQTYDDMHEEWGLKTMTVAEAMDEFSDEGCPPTVDVEPIRHGEWVATKINATVTDFRCSECGRYVMCGNDYYMKPTKYANKHFPYCHCGAKMDKGVQNDQN